MTRALPWFLTLVLAGCIAGPAEPPAGEGFSSEAARAARTYLTDLADAAESTADTLQSGDTRTNLDAFERFQASSRSARDRFNRSLGAAFDGRSPPAGSPDAAAWRELAAAFRRVAK